MLAEVKQSYKNIKTECKNYPENSLGLDQPRKDRTQIEHFLD